MAMPAADPGPHDPFAAVVRQAAQRAHPMALALLEQAQDALRRQTQSQRDLRERQAQEDTLKHLLREQDRLARLFADALLAALASASRNPDSGRPLADLRFGDLELMGDDQIQERVELARVQQAAESAVDHLIGDMNGYLCAAQGLATVQPERNPLRPQTYVHALRDAVARFDLLPAERRRWLQALGEGLGRCLRTEYEAALKALRAEGVRPADYAVLAVPGAPTTQRRVANVAGAAGASAGTARRTPSDASPAPAGRTDGARAQLTDSHAALLNMARLHRLITGQTQGLDEPAAAGSPPGGGAMAPAPESVAWSHEDQPPPRFSATVPAALEALADMRQVDRVIQRLEGPRTDGGSDRERLREQARQSGRGWAAELSIEVVALILDNITADERLPQPARQALSRLEPALLRLALADPRFFSDRGHPARVLLDRVTQHALGWRGPEDEGFAEFLAPLQEVAERLGAQEQPQAAQFAASADWLEATWAAQTEQARLQREQAVQALLRAEQRSAVAARFAAEFRAHPAAGQLDLEVLEFLVGPWAQVLAQARLDDRSGVPDPGGYLGMAGELIWSAQPALAGFNRARLARVVPGLLRGLRQGLALIDWPDGRSAPFFAALMRLHEQGLKPAAVDPAAAPPARDEVAALTRAQLEERFSDGDDEAWLAPREAQDSGFIDAEAVESSPEGFASTQPWQPSVPPGSGEPELLSPGQWFELQIDGRWRRVQLTWASPQRKLFLFTGGQGQSHSMTRRVADAALQCGSLRLVAAHSLVDGALDAVAQTALRNSLDRPL